MENNIKLSFIGDILCDASMDINRYKENGVYNFGSIFSAVSSVFSKSDFVFANLETPISVDNNNLTYKRYEFNSPFEFAKAIKDMGVNYVSTANNHCLDRGITGIISTIKSLDDIQLLHSGTYIPGEKRHHTIINISGMKVGVLSYTYGTNAFSNNQYLNFKNRKIVDLIQEQELSTEKYKKIKHFLSHHPRSLLFRGYSWVDRKIHKENIGKQEYEKTTFNKYRLALLKKDIRSLKRKTDMLIMYLHIGGQYNYEPSEYTKRTIKYLLKHGINIIIGNHEHVVHGIVDMTEKNKFATYAIGNFLGGAGVSYEPFDRNADYSVVPHVYIDINTKKISKISFSITRNLLVEDGKYMIVPVYDYINNCDMEERETVIKNALDVAKSFSNKEYKIIEEEFSI